jgi:hypothetical protein
VVYFPLGLRIPIVALKILIADAYILINWSAANAGTNPESVLRAY